MHPPEWRVSALRAALALAFPARAAGGFGLWPVDGEGVPGGSATLAGHVIVDGGCDGELVFGASIWGFGRRRWGEG